MTIKFVAQGEVTLFRVHEMCQSCQTWPAKFWQILLRN